MTLDNMNKGDHCPKKDYEANRLVTGTLQLSDGECRSVAWVGGVCWGRAVQPLVLVLLLNNPYTPLFVYV